MDEADRIILETLLSLGCHLNEDQETGEAITRVGQMTSEVVVAVVAKLLVVIDPSLKPPSSLPPSMTARFKVATELADVVKSLGYTGEAGYETFLWVEESRVRGVLLFLVSKLPSKEAPVPSQVCSGRTLLMRRVAAVLRKQVWKPSYLHQQEDDTTPFQSHPLFTPFHLINPISSSAQKNLQNLLSLSQQIQEKQQPQQQHQQPQQQHQQLQQQHQQQQPQQQQQQQHRYNVLFSSILEHNLLSLLKQQQTYRKRSRLQDMVKKQPQFSLSTSSPIVPPSSLSSSSSFRQKPLTSPKPIAAETKEYDDEDDEEEEDDEDDGFTKPTIKGEEEEEEEEDEEKKRKRLEEDVMQLKGDVTQVQHHVTSIKSSIGHTKLRVAELEGLNEERKKKTKMKRAVLKLLPRGEEAVNQMKELIGEMEGELGSMEVTWSKEREELQAMLQQEASKDHETRSLLDTRSEELSLLRMRIKEVTSQRAEKEALHKELAAQHDKRTEGSSRASYNKRILEIVNNIHKQNNEIQKVVEDTRVVQADVNRLSGVVSRSFLSADDVIFKAAQKDETARKAYKLLASLHESCGSIVVMVEEIGKARKRMADVEEQLTLAKNSKVTESLKQLEGDLEALKRENQALIKQLKPTS